MTPVLIGKGWLVVQTRGHSAVTGQTFFVFFNKARSKWSSLRGMCNTFHVFESKYKIPKTVLGQSLYI